MPPSIRAISLWQPWASLIALGIKHYETRSWRMNYSGPLAIHAAKTTRGVMAYEFVKGTDSNEDAQLILDALHAAGVGALADLPLGAVLCETRAVGTVPVEAIRDGLTPIERAVGDYRDGRWAVELDLVEVYKEPIPAKGQQGLWSWEKVNHG